MGFSLKMFFRDLRFIISDSSIFTVMGRLKKFIDEQEQYAKDCGQLK